MNEDETTVEASDDTERPTKGRPRPEVDARSGPVTGAQIVRVLAQTPAAPGHLAEILGLEESYVRRICRQLVRAGILTFEVVPQRGTPPLKLYSLVPVPIGGPGGSDRPG